MLAEDDSVSVRPENAAPPRETTYMFGKKPTHPGKPTAHDNLMKSAIERDFPAPVQPQPVPENKNLFERNQRAMDAALQGKEDANNANDNSLVVTIGG